MGEHVPNRAGPPLVGPLVAAQQGVELQRGRDEQGEPFAMRRFDRLEQLVGVSEIERLTRRKQVGVVRDPARQQIAGLGSTRHAEGIEGKPGATEVDGLGRSKTALVVGIDGLEELAVNRALARHDKRGVALPIRDVLPLGKGLTTMGTHPHRLRVDDRVTHGVARRRADVDLPAVRGQAHDAAIRFVAQGQGVDHHHRSASARLLDPVQHELGLGAGLAGGARCLRQRTEARCELGKERLEHGGLLGQGQPRQGGPRLKHGDGVDIGADNMRAQANRLVDRRPAAQHRVEDDLVLQAAHGVVVAAAWIVGQLLENGAEGCPRPARPPLVQVGVGAEQVLVEGLDARQGIHDVHRERGVDADAVGRGGGGGEASLNAVEGQLLRLGGGHAWRPKWSDLQ